MRRALLVVGLLLGPCLLAAPASAGEIPVTMGLYPGGAYPGPGIPYAYGETSIFRGLVNFGSLVTIPDLFISDIPSTGGSDGVFTGFDLDFIILDKDGDLSTTYDQYRPTGAKITQQGFIRNQGSSYYQPTTQHPGSLFGINADGTINMLTATLGTRDANFVYGNMAVNTSYGWVTLGQKGQIQVSFANVANTGSMYLFLGEVGKRDEFAGGRVTYNNVPDPNVKHIYMSYNSSWILNPGDVAQLSAVVAQGTSWSWKIRPTSTTFTDGYGPLLYISAESFKNDYGFENYYQWYRAWVEVNFTNGDPAQYYYADILLTPEPGTMTLMTIGAIGILLDRRRRRKAGAAAVARQVA